MNPFFWLNLTIISFFIAGHTAKKQTSIQFAVILVSRLFCSGILELAVEGYF